MASITKRGAYWRVQIVRRGYAPQYRTFDSKAEANAWVRETETEMDRGVFVPRHEAEQTTLAEALNRYRDEVSPLKGHPASDYQRVKHWLKQPLAHRFLATLRGADFARYRDERRALGRAENTIRLELALVSHLFETCRKEWGMEYLMNPLKNIRKPSGSRERDRRLHAGEYDLILAELRKSENRFVAPAFQLAIETSLRQSMLFSLRWEWLDMRQRVIFVPASFRAMGNKCVPGAVPLSSVAVQVLMALGPQSHGLILNTTKNAALLVWKRVIKRLRIENLRWHDLRHEAASRLFEKGLHPLEVATVTGHKSLTMLRRYTHLQPQDLVAKLG
jgi:integrase